MSMISDLARRRAKEESERAARALVTEKWKDFCRKSDISIAYVLHTEFGFGAGRIARFFGAWKRVHYDMTERFCDGNDDGQYFVMERRLCDGGITPEVMYSQCGEEDGD